jgi:hypothetical protein
VDGAATTDLADRADRRCSVAGCAAGRLRLELVQAARRAAGKPGIGRPFTIQGDLVVDLGSIVVIETKGLSLANAPWSKHAEMAHADMLRLEVPFWPLLRGERLLRRLDVVRPRLLLERNARGEANWKIERPEKDRAARPARAWKFGELRIHEGELSVRDEPFDTDLKLRVDSIPVDTAGETTRLLGQGSGRYKGHEFNLEGRADSPTVLFVSGDENYDVDFKARAGATRARVWGALPVPLNFKPLHGAIAPRRRRPRGYLSPARACAARHAAVRDQRCARA